MTGLAAASHSKSSSKDGKEQTGKLLFPVWIRNRLLTAVSQPCLASYYRQFSTNIRIKIMILIPVLLARAFGHFWSNKTSFNLIIIIHFNIRGKLSIILCDKYLFQLPDHLIDLCVLIALWRFPQKCLIEHRTGTPPHIEIN